MPFWLRLALRAPAIVFFFLTAAFAVLSHIRFTYLQFLRHQLFGWIELFVAFHHYLFWAAFLLGLLSVADDVKRRRSVMAFGFAGVVGGLLFSRPLLTTLGSDDRSLIVALAALVPPFWLALIDHQSARQGLPSGTARQVGVWSHLLIASLLTSVYVWLTFAAIAAVRTLVNGAPAQVDWGGYLISAFFSLAMHIAAGSAAFAMLATALLTTSRRAQYWCVLVTISVAACGLLLQVVFPFIAFRGLRPVVVASAVAGWSAIVWSGLAVRRAAARNDAADALEILAGPIAPARGLVWILAALSIVAYLVIARIAVIDWHFLLQIVVAAGVWTVGFALLYRLTASWQCRRAFVFAAALLMGGCSASVLSVQFRQGDDASRLAKAVDRYSPYDASLMLIERFTRPASSGLAELTTLLVANSDLPASMGIRAASVDFERPLVSPGARKPHVFLFVIDSLRRDYLSIYNPAVTFTPNVQAFAEKSIGFRNAFTRYGGTGLSEPAIWSGALLPHRQYVTPFGPMNTLEKLLDVEGYDRLVSVDSILRELLTPTARLRELDAGVQNRLYDSCRTFDEIRSVLQARAQLPSQPLHNPLFVFSQPQDLHLANVAVDRTAIHGEMYAGFHPQYAARVKRFDRCFGRFIDFLEASGILDSSVVILTSDHGDSLGDEGRWGHAFTVFPEIVRIPLVVHLPDWLRHLTVDPDAVALSTDIAPTLYKLLGHEPARREPVLGESLIGADDERTHDRRRRSYLLISSYGPVYGLLANNGSDLYIIDGVNTAEHQYDLRIGLNGARTAVTDRQRRMAQDEIRRQVGAVAEYYEYSAE
jgi:hypothetical protein